VYLVILLAAAAILAGVVVVSMGGGGEMALFDRDLPIKITRLRTPGEVANLQLPFGLIGYQARATGEALIVAANLLARRDAEIAGLRREIWRLGGDDQLDVFDGPGPERAELGPERADFDAAGDSGGAASDSSGTTGDPGEEAFLANDLGRDQASPTGRRDETGEQDGAGQSDQASRS